MNTELRNKLFNKIKDVFENEDTQEREAYLQARESVDHHYKYASELAKLVVERSYPTEDVATLRHFKKKYGNPCDVVAKDKCFYFAHSEDRDEDGDMSQKIRPLMNSRFCQRVNNHKSNIMLDYPIVKC